MRGEDVLIMAASGLLWLAELIEEHSRYAKAIGMRGIYVRPVSVVLEAMILISTARILRTRRWLAWCARRLLPAHYYR